MILKLCCQSALVVGEITGLPGESKVRKQEERGGVAEKVQTLTVLCESFLKTSVLSVFFFFNFSFIFHFS